MNFMLSIALLASSTCIFAQTTLSKLESMTKKKAFSQCQLSKIVLDQYRQEERLSIQLIKNERKYAAVIIPSKRTDQRKNLFGETIEEYQFDYHQHGVLPFMYTGKRRIITQVKTKNDQLISIKVRLKNLDFPKVTVKSVTCD
jgi:hypothetical protein